MSADLVILKSIVINSGPSGVWDVLTNPEKISLYFSGAVTLTDWQVGSDIIFIHNYEDHEFRNKGVILKFEINHLLQYTYWTAFSNTPDQPENYTTLTYALAGNDNTTTLTLTQSNFKDKDWYQGLQTGWDSVLATIKEVAENRQ